MLYHGRYYRVANLRRPEDLDDELGTGSPRRTSTPRLDGNPNQRAVGPVRLQVQGYFPAEGKVRGAAP